LFARGNIFTDLSLSSSFLLIKEMRKEPKIDYLREEQVAHHKFFFSHQQNWTDKLRAAEHVVC
jgi:hypothetical protein